MARVLGLVAALAVAACAGQGAAVGAAPAPPAPPARPATQASPAPRAGVDLRLPLAPDSVRFAVFGDSGSGAREQMETAAMMARYHEAFPFTFAVMLGDNIYEPDRPTDYRQKFEVPYAPLLSAGVKFHAALGNHDNRNQTRYALFNMNGERFYSFKPRNGVRFFALDSNYLDPPQLQWLEKELQGSGSEWKIVFMHHPLYSSGDKHGPSVDKRRVLEPLLVKYGVDLVLAGHEHFYERIKPQQGIHHIISGGAGKLRRGGNVSEITAKGFDDDYHFVLMELVGEELHFQTITRRGVTVDSGVLRRREVTTPARTTADH